MYVTEQQIHKWITALKAIADAPGNSIEARIAWDEYHLLRRIVENVHDWPDIVQSVKETAEVIRRDIELLNE